MSRKRLSGAEIQAILNEEEELGDTASDDDEEIDGVISGSSESTEDSDEDVGDLETPEADGISDQNVFKSRNGNETWGKILLDYMGDSQHEI